MKYLTVAIVSALLFASVAYASTPSKSIKDRVLEKVPLGSTINSTLNGVGAIKDHIVEKIPGGKKIDSALHGAADLLVHPKQTIKSGRKAVDEILNGFAMYFFMIVVPLYLAPLKTLVTELTVGENRKELWGNITLAMQDHIGALSETIKDIDFTEVWKEHYNEDLAAGLGRIKACTEQPKKAILKCVGKEIYDIIRKFIENLKEHKDDIIDKFREYFSEYDFEEQRKMFAKE